MCVTLRDERFNLFVDTFEYFKIHRYVTEY